jgi:hypothetical protein
MVAAVSSVPAHGATPHPGFFSGFFSRPAGRPGFFSCFLLALEVWDVLSSPAAPPAHRHVPADTVPAHAPQGSCCGAAEGGGGTVIDVVRIPADPAAPVGIESLDDGDPAAFQRLVSGYVDVVYVDDDLSFLLRRGAELRGFPVNSRACLLAMSRDPEFTDVALCGDALAVGPFDGRSHTAAPEWLRRLCRTPARFQILDITAGRDKAEVLPLNFPDLFLGLAAIAGLSRRFPDRSFRLSPIDAHPPRRGAGPVV